MSAHHEQVGVRTISQDSELLGDIGAQNHAPVRRIDELIEAVVSEVSAQVVMDVAGDANAYAAGFGAFTDGRRIQVSQVKGLKDAHLALASLDSWLSTQMFKQLEHIAQREWTTTGYVDFWIHMLVAEGAADAALEPVGAVWDFAALKVIVEEAGGRFTDFSAKVSASGGSGLSSNGGPIHGELLTLLG